MIVDATRGLVLTNNHVVEHAVAIAAMTQDRRRFDAESVERAPGVDLAVLRIPPQRLPAAPLGDSDAAQVGDYVVAIGNPCLYRCLCRGGRSGPGNVNRLGSGDRHRRAMGATELS